MRFLPVPFLLAMALSLSAMPGDPLIGEPIVARTGNLIASAGTIYRDHYTNLFDDVAFVPLVKPPPGRRIAGMRLKESKHPKDTYVVLLDDNTVMRLEMTWNGRRSEVTFWGMIGKLASAGSESFRKISGDDLYILTTSNVYVSRDGGATWSLDTAGLAKAKVNDIEVDSAQRVFAATDKGLFRQAPDSSLWHRIEALPETKFSSVFADRKGRLGAVAAPGLHTSVDAGLTWSSDSGTGNLDIGVLADDAEGNWYALGNDGNRLYRRRAGETSWARIDSALVALNADPEACCNIRLLWGDSLLRAGTPFGIAVSRDRGATWSLDTAGPRAENVTALAHAGSDRWFAATRLGVFRVRPGDKAWGRVFPGKGYMAGKPIWMGPSGQVFTQGVPVRVGSNLVQLPHRSTDGGSTWVPDTAGFGSLVGFNLFFIDERGNQFAASTASSSRFSHVYRKRAGEAWTLDTNGLAFDPASRFGSQPMGFGSDGKGYAYASFPDGDVFRQAVDETVWSLDTAALINRGFRRMWTGRDGDLFGSGDQGGLYLRRDGKWNKLATPPGTAADLVTALAVDSGGAVFAAFERSPSNAGGGVHWTADAGRTWKLVGLEGFGVNALAAGPDSVYAATTRGIIGMTRDGVDPALRVLRRSERPSLVSVRQRSGRLEVVLDLDMPGTVRIGIFDIGGRPLAASLRKRLPAGRHALGLGTGSGGPGLRILRVEAGGNVLARRVLVYR